MKPQLPGSKEGFLEEEWCLEKRLHLGNWVAGRAGRSLMTKDTVPR